jgi:putative DNA primase/helicase
MLQEALWYAESGIRVFPCWPRSKNPATKNGFYNATDNVEQVREWWRLNPEYNIGIHTSKESGLIVLDVDKKNGGLQTLAALEKQYGPLPNTWRARTGGGGFHLYFKHPGGYVAKSEGKIGPGIDVRGDNGYALAPPSIHDKTGDQYVWEVQETLHEAPSWIIELNDKPAEQRGQKKKKGRKKKRVPEGKRHTFLVEHAGRLRRLGYEEGFIKQALELVFKEECEQEPPAAPGYFEKVANSSMGWDPETSYNRTDMGNAARFHEMHKSCAAYCPTWKTWMIWDESRWDKDTDLQIQELAKRSVERIKDESRKMYDDGRKEEGAEHYKWYVKSQSAERLNAMVKLARSLMAVSPEQFDTDDWLLNVKNGTVDLRTGELRKHDPEDWITKLAPVRYNPEAKRTLFTRFLNDIFQKNQNLIEFVQKFFGYSLTGDTRERLFIVFQGKGRNGKSTLIELITDVMGEYAEQIPPEALLESRKTDDGGPNPSIAKLKGIRLACAQESAKNKCLDAALIKRLTGQDKIATRFLHSNEFSFRPKFKLLLSTNPLPRISADDQAAWDRVRRIPFSVRMKTIRDPNGTIDEDRSLPTKLKREYQGILAWCVEGCLKWQREGLDAPDCVATATDEYRAGEDIIREYLDDCCLFGEGERVPKTKLYEAYQNWCGRSGHKFLSSTNFNSAVEGRGYKEERHNNIRCWEGLSLNEGATANY